MDVYSPSHPTDQDMDMDSIGDQPTPTEEEAITNSCSNSKSISLVNIVSDDSQVIKKTDNEFSLSNRTHISVTNEFDQMDFVSPSAESLPDDNKCALKSDAITNDVLKNIYESAHTLMPNPELPTSDACITIVPTPNDSTFDFTNYDFEDHANYMANANAEKIVDSDSKDKHGNKGLNNKDDKSISKESLKHFKDKTEKKSTRTDHGKLETEVNTTCALKDKSNSKSSKSDNGKLNSEENLKHDSKDKSGKLNTEENLRRDVKNKVGTKILKNDSEKLTTEEIVNKDVKLNKDENIKTSAEKNISSHSKSDKGRHSKSRTSRNRSRTPKKRSSKSKDKRSSRRRSSSRSRRRRHSRSRSRERRHRRSRSTSRSRHSQHGRDSKRSHRSRSGSRNRNERRLQNDTQRPRRDRPQEPEIQKLENISFSPRPYPSSPQMSLKHVDNIQFDCKPAELQWDEGDDMEETSTPDISENQPGPIKNLMDAQFDHNNIPDDLAAAFRLHNQPPPPPPPQTTAPDFMNWQQNYLNTHNEHHHPFSQANRQFPEGFQQQHFYPPGQDMPPPHGLNPIYQHTQLNNFPPGNSHTQVMTMNGMPITPLMGFGGLLTQPPPPPSIPPMRYGAPPPPPFIQQFQPPPMPPQIVTVSQQFYEQAPINVQTRPLEPRMSRSRFSDVATTQEAPNLLETLMSKAGLPTNSISGINISDKQTVPPPPSIPIPESNEDKSPMKKINKLLNTAANTLLSHLNEAQKMVPGNVSPPPPPPPPLPLPNNPSHSFSASPNKPFVPPPLPTISSNVFNMNVMGNGSGNPQMEPRKHKYLADYDVHEMLAKRRRSEFATTREWQERIALEVKSFIKPTYAAGKLSKDDCRVILKKSVTKISRSRCTSINTKKIGDFTKAYVKKYYKYRRWQQKQRAAAEPKTSIVQ